MTRSSSIDRAKVRILARTLDDAGQRDWIDRAIDLLSDDGLVALTHSYARVDELCATESTSRLLAEVRRFYRDAVAGQYYESFAVNSRNFMDQSRGTETFIEEHQRLTAACLRATDRAVSAQGLELLIELMRAIDACNDDVIFFADEGGAWQVGVDWDLVLPAWAKAISPEMAPDDWAWAVASVFDDFVSAGQRSTIPKAVRDAGTPAQQAALDALNSG